MQNRDGDLQRPARRRGLPEGSFPYGRDLARVLVTMLVLSLLGLRAVPGYAGEERAGEERAGDEKAGQEKAGEHPEERFINEHYDVEFRKRVNESIDRGVMWLRAQQQPDGAWASPHNKGYPMGPSALALLTLLKGGVLPKAPVICRAFQYLRRLPLKKTYSVGLLLMALDAKYGAARDPFVVQEVDRYGRSARKDPCLEHISKADLAWMRAGVKFLLDAQTADGVWRYPSKAAFDLSNTQYALLGLKAAMRCGIKVPAGVWQSALTYLLDWQEAEGKEVTLRGNEVRGRYRIQWTEKARARGFRYATRKDPVTGAMTTAGLASLIICQGQLWSSRRFRGALRLRTRVGIRDAIAWIQTYFTVVLNPIQPEEGRTPDARGAGNDFYYLYGLERASILGRVRHYGPYDWYDDGAELFMHDQFQDGHWTAPEDPVSTCFALLFLKRATSRMSVPVITPASGKAPADPRSGK